MQQPHIPVFFGGSSDIAIDIAGRLADVYAFWGETLDQARETIARVRAATARAGRDPAAIRFSMSFRPVLAGTEAAAWLRADRIIARIRELRADAVGGGGPKPESIGSKRLLDAAAGGRVRDKLLWTEVAAVVGAGANTTALVGTAEQVAQALAEYHALGVDHLPDPRLRPARGRGAVRRGAAAGDPRRHRGATRSDRGGGGVTRRPPGRPLDAPGVLRLNRAHP